MESHVSQSQPGPLVTPQQETISTSEEMVDFGEGFVVSMGNYFWSRKGKEAMKKGNKKTRKGMVKKVLSLNHVIWRVDSPNIKHGDLDTMASMGEFCRIKI